MPRIVYLCTGFLALGLGGVGIVVPLLPTTPFIILAAFCFSKSSRRLHQYLLQHPIFGELIVKWQRYGVIKPQVKYLVVFLVTASLGLSFYFFQIPLWSKVVAASSCAAVLGYIISRPGDEAEALRRKNASK